MKYMCLVVDTKEASVMTPEEFIAMALSPPMVEESLTELQTTCNRYSKYFHGFTDDIGFHFEESTVLVGSKHVKCWNADDGHGLLYRVFEIPD